MTLTIGQMMSLLGAGALMGMAGLMALAGALTARYGDQEGGCFAHFLALLAAAGGVTLLALAMR